MGSEKSAGLGPTAVVFTDIQGSVRLWETVGPAFEHALERHNSILRQCVARHAGLQGKFLGDGYLLLFDAAAQAVACALEIQDRIARTRWPAGVEGLSVRIGIHTGGVSYSQGEPVGPTVNLASRVMEAAHGGQVLLTQDAADLAGPCMGSGVHLLDAGLHRLRDVLRPVRLVLAVPAGQAVPKFIPVRSLDALPTNLPVELDQFVGRETELRAIDALLDERGARLVTLVGLGGVGKTRLLLKAGARRLDSFADGVWLVDLSDVPSPDDVPRAIGVALHMPGHAGGREALQPLAAAIGNRHLLLLLDNYEQVIGAATLPPALLRACEHLVCLVTSRERLRVPGECVLEVHPLAAPDENAPAAEQVACDSMRLFGLRAADARAGRALSAAELQAAAQICRNLCGIPLALEIAAAHLSHLSVAELLAGLATRAVELATDARGVPERHHSMRAVMDWSYLLLADHERRVLEQVSVFHGGFTAQAAPAVVQGAEDVPAALRALQDKSLLQVETLHGRTRYGMLPPVRDYALERLGDDALPCAHRAARYYCELAAGLHVGDALSDLQLAAEELENFRAALAWAKEHDECELLALAMCRIWPLMNLQGAIAEAIDWLQLAIDCCRTREQARRHRGLLVALAVCLKLDRQFERAQDALDRCAVLSAEAKAPNDATGLWRMLEQGALLYEMGCREEAAVALERSREANARAGQLRWVAESLRCLAKLALDEQAPERAETLLTEALALEDPQTQAWGVSNTLCQLARVRRARGDLGGARGALEESVRLCREVGDRPGLAERLTDLAVVTLQAGDLAAATAACQEALALARRFAPAMVEGVLKTMELCA